jgi:hypothetical protein
MLKKRGQRHAERFCQVAHSSRPAAKAFEHRSSCRVGETVEHAIQLGGLLVRHMPYYICIEYLGQYLTVQGTDQFVKLSAEEIPNTIVFTSFTQDFIIQRHSSAAVIRAVFTNS